MSEPARRTADVRANQRPSTTGSRSRMSDSSTNRTADTSRKRPGSARREPQPTYSVDDGPSQENAANGYYTSTTTNTTDEMMKIIVGGIQATEESLAKTLKEFKEFRSSVEEQYRKVQEEANRRGTPTEQQQPGRLADKYYTEAVELKQENAKLKTNLRTETETVEKLTNEITELEKENKSLLLKQTSSAKDQQKQKAQYDHYVKQILEEKAKIEQNTEALKGQMRQMEVTYQRTDIELNLLRTKAKEAEEAKKDALSRLSRQMGEKMTEGNAAIADLSDKDRPTKLAEKYNEIYDNTWTDALGILTDDKGKSEVSAAQILLNILMDCFQYCKDTVAEQTSNLYSSLLLCEEVEETTLSSDVKGLIKDARKATSSVACNSRYQTFKRKLDSGSSLHELCSHYVEQYVQECFEVCWQMCLRDPPLVLAPLPEIGSNRDLDMYKEYTRSGSKVDYVVWPALLLYKDGPLLGKGVVQPKEEKKQNRQRPQSARDLGHDNNIWSPKGDRNPEKTVRSRTVYVHQPYSRANVDTDLQDNVSKKNYTQLPVSTSRFDQEFTPKSRPSTTPAKTQNYETRTQRDFNQSGGQDSVGSAAAYDNKPFVTQSEIDQFISDYYLYGSRHCQELYGELFGPLVQAAVERNKHRRH